MMYCRYIDVQTNRRDITQTELECDDDPRCCNDEFSGNLTRGSVMERICDNFKDNIV